MAGMIMIDTNNDSPEQPKQNSECGCPEEAVRTVSRLQL
jgi:hypothetical protein